MEEEQKDASAAGEGGAREGAEEEKEEEGEGHQSSYSCGVDGYKHGYNILIEEEHGYCFLPKGF